MSIEFISAKDLPTTEAEEVDVLCVENGELKRKPGASLGGGGSYDFIVKLWLENENDELVYRGELVEGTFDAAFERLENGEAITALVSDDGTAQTEIGEGGWKYCGVSEVALIISADGEMYFRASGWNGLGYIMQDNTLEAEWW